LNLEERVEKPLWRRLVLGAVYCFDLAFLRIPEIQPEEEACLNQVAWWFDVTCPQLLCRHPDLMGMTVRDRPWFEGYLQALG